MQTFKVLKIVSFNGLILLAFFATLLVAKAEENTKPEDTELSNQSTSTVPSRDPEVEPVALPVRQEIAPQNLGTNNTGSLDLVRQSRVLNLSANLSNRMEAVIARLLNITNRLHSRIEKITAFGIDTNAAATKLNEANNLLAQASASITNIDTLVYNATTSPDPKVGWVNVRTVYTETARLVRAAHLAIRETIVLLKNSETRSNLDQSTTTASDNTATETIE